MRILPLIISTAITVGLVVTLNTKLLLKAPLGKLLSPQHGVWQNAENMNTDFGADLKFPQLKGKVNVYLDERLVPHVFAEEENDVYFVQGFLHAKFRLWQMEMQTHAAAGRASEIVGSIGLKHDREFRRLGMVYAAEASLKEMEKVATPDQKTIEEVATFLNVEAVDCIKTLIFQVDENLVAVLCRGDHEINYITLKNALYATTVEFAFEGDVLQLLSC